jgi:ATP-binding cassette subfamily C protein
VVVAHRPSALAGLDHLLVLEEGRVKSFGPKDEVIGKVIRPVPSSAGQIRSTEARGAV